MTNVLRYTTRSSYVLGLSLSIIGVMLISACSSASPAAWQDASAETVKTVSAEGNYEFAVVGDVGLVVKSDETGEFAVHAIDISTKERLWKLEGVFEANIWVAADKLVTENENEAEVRSISTGKDLFSVPLQGSSDDAGRISTVTETTVVIQNPNGQKGELAAFDLDSSDKTWTWQGGDDEGPESTGSDPEVWANTVSATPTTGYPHELNSRSPTIRSAIDTDIIYVSEEYDTSGGEASAVDIETGKQLWEQKSPNSGWVSIMEQIASDRVVMRPGSLPQDSTDCVRTMVSVDTSTEEATEISFPRFYYNPGTKEWECGTGDEVTPISPEGILAQDEEYRPQLLDIATGEPLWTAKDSAEPLALEDSIAIYRTWNKDNDSKMHAVDTTNGKTLWAKPVSNALERVIVFNDQVFRTTDDGTWVNDLESGERLWQHLKSRPLHLSEDAYFFLSTDEKLRITQLQPDGN